MKSRTVPLFLDTDEPYPAAAAMVERAYRDPWPAVVACLLLVTAGALLGMDALAERALR